MKQYENGIRHISKYISGVVLKVADNCGLPPNGKIYLTIKLSCSSPYSPKTHNKLGRYSQVVKDLIDGVLEVTVLLL